METDDLGLQQSKANVHDLVLFSTWLEATRGIVMTIGRDWELAVTEFSAQQALP